MMQSATHIGARSYGSLQRFLSGLFVTDLVTDIEGPGVFTLVAPVDDAFDALRWPFERLLEDVALVEPRHDLFEYLVIPGRHAAHCPIRPLRTLQGDMIGIGAGSIVGEQGASRVVATTAWRGALVHVVERCVLPSSFGLFPDP